MTGKPCVRFHRGSPVQAECGEQRRGRRDPAEDAALRLDHRDPRGVEFGEVGASAVLQHETVEAAIVGLAHRGVDADLGCDAANQKLSDAAAAQHGFQIGGVERAFAGLVHDRLAGVRGQVRR